MRVPPTSFNSRPCLIVNSVGVGDRVVIPIYAMNTDKEVWGKDSFEFKSVLQPASVPALKLI